MDRDPYAGVLHTCKPSLRSILMKVNRLNTSFQTLLQNHKSLKAQNDDIIVRVGMEQQFAINPILKGKQTEEDTYRGGIGETNNENAVDSREPVGLVSTGRR
jgi:hypothetical protein